MSVMTVDVRKAVLAAIDYLKSVEDLVTESAEDIKDLRLEETELTENEQYWLITLSYDIPVGLHRDRLQAILSSTNRQYEREYRIFKIDTQTGEVKSMKIREQ